MKYAVIAEGGKQYVVTEGKILTVDRLKIEEGKAYKTDKVLLVRDKDQIAIGAPFVEGASVSGRIQKHYQGDKLHIYKFKAKVRYRRKMGFRPQLTDYLVEKISFSEKSKSAPIKSGSVSAKATTVPVKKNKKA